MFRNRPPTVPGSPVSSLASVPPISTIHKDSEGSGKACILSGDKQSCQTKHSSLNQWRYSIYMHVEFFFVFCWSCELNENEYLKITWSICNWKSFYRRRLKIFVDLPRDPVRWSLQCYQTSLLPESDTSVHQRGLYPGPCTPPRRTSPSSLCTHSTVLSTKQ